jgi:hypothetical protein
VHDGRTLLYRASKLDCDICPLKARCCPGQLARKIPRDVHEDARDMARRLMGSKAFIKSRDERKRVEMRFAHLKIQHGFERMRLRGLSGARDDFHLAAIVQNLKTLALRAPGVTASEDQATSKARIARAQVEYVASTLARSKTPTFSTASVKLRKLGTSKCFPLCHPGADVVAAYWQLCRFLRAGWPVSFGRRLVPLSH